MNPDRNRRLVAEAVGTAILLAAVVGSGIMAERLAGGNQAIALLANTTATGAALVALILTFGPFPERISTRRSLSLMRRRAASRGERFRPTSRPRLPVLSLASGPRI
jgi:hypothetical protein